MVHRERATPEELLAQLKPQHHLPIWRRPTFRLSLVALLMILLISSLRGQWGQRGKIPSVKNEAQAELEKLKKAPLKSSEAYYLRAEVLREHAHFSEAIDDYNALLKENPSSIKALALRADSWTQLGQYAKAQADWSLILKRYPQDLTALNQRGVTALRMGKFAQARADFDAALRRHPKEAVLWANRGLSWLEDKQLTLAQTDLKKALALNPRLPESHFFWGRLQLAQHNSNEALKAFSNTLILYPEHVQARYERGQLYTRLGPCKQARLDLQKACRLGDTRACKPFKCQAPF
ncbi:MAG: tetratricopeptide repeat protein [Candidatus Sericytochromatia bacterium]